MITVKPYCITDKELWDDFIHQSKNGTFLLKRTYMTYHADRFQDASLIFFDKNQQVIAVFPANQHDKTIISHAGLTYGGFVYHAHMTQPLMIAVFQALLTYLLNNHITTLIYKTIPSIYHKGPADEDLYVLFLLSAQLIRRDSLTVIDHSYRIDLQQRRKRALNKGKKHAFQLNRLADFSNYWHLLTKNLQQKHQVNPVHSNNEIQYLADQFPEHIKLFTCSEQQELLAGIVVYETEQVAHFQYIAASDQGKQVGALDWLFMSLITNIYAEKRYIDFGISNEEQGTRLNQGLIEFKEGFGGRTIIHDHYRIDLTPKHMTQLNQVLL